MRPGSTILITGCSTGIGLALALHFAQLGHRVFAGVRHERDAKVLHDRSAGRITPVMLDVTSSDAVDAGVAFVAGQTDGQLDVLINNAGVAFSGPLEMTSQAELRKLMDVNVMGAFAMTRACLPLLRQAKGRIVNISSISGVFAAPGLTAYAASKHALEGLTAALRLELAPFGVKVCSIAPGKIDTPIWDKAQAISDTMQDGRQALRTLYRPLIAFYERYAETERGTPLDTLMQCVEQALHSPAPKARYLVGRSARLRAALKLLPGRWREWVVLTRMNSKERC